jgi:A/G-specific adenine glycosylase
VLKQLWALAEQLTPAQRVAHYNQAMMDLGATVCTRSSPDCAQCPLQQSCQAFKQGRQTQFPGRKPRREQPVRYTHMLVLRSANGELLMERRPPSGIWGGLLSFPECEQRDAIEDYCRQSLGFRIATLEFLPTRRHTFSHFHLEFTPVLISKPLPIGVQDENRYHWQNPQRRIAGGLPAPVAQLIADLSTNHQE